MAGNDKYRIDEDGTMRVKKLHCRRFGIYESFLPEREYEYPCMGMDGDRLFFLTMLGGWFGLHKFMTGHYLSGIFYSLTCGGCGVAYVCDLIAMLTGDYVDEKISFGEEAGRIVQHRERFYNRPVEKRRIAIAGIFFAVMMAVLLVKLVYIPIMAFVSQGLMGIRPSEGMTEWMVDMWL